jgi:TetR/AcrR family transcriptional regulator, transcriptional repressor of bet genes
MGAIMKEAGISRGLVGYHFGSQANLLVAAFDRLCDDYRERLGIGSGRNDEVGEDPEWQLIVAIRRAFTWPAGYFEREYAYFGFWALARTNPRLRAVNRRMNDQVATRLAALLEAAAVKRGRTINAAAAGRELSATIDGAWLHLTTRVAAFTPDQAVAMCTGCIERLLEQATTAE